MYDAFAGSRKPEISAGSTDTIPARCRGRPTFGKKNPNTNKTHDSTYPQSFPFIQIHAQQPTPKLHLDTHAPINPRHHASEAPHRTDHMH